MGDEHARAQARAQLARELVERAKIARRRRSDDDGAAELIPTGPPKKPRGGSPAFATRSDDGNELTAGVNKVHTV